jgi:hypothetical protein
LNQATETSALQAVLPASLEEDTQSPSLPITEAGGVDRMSKVILLASLGIISFGHEKIVSTVSGHESTYTVRPSIDANVNSMITRALSAIHEKLLRESVELDIRAREVLTKSLWDLYTT